MDWQKITEAILRLANAFLDEASKPTIPVPTIPQKPPIVTRQVELNEDGYIQLNNDDKLIAALIKVESSSKEFPNGNDNAIGDKHLVDKAYGCLQIRRPVCLDVNRVYKTNYTPMAMLNNRELSIKVARLYWTIYKCKTNEEKARCWNGGPTAKTPGSKMYKATNGYWAKVKAHL